MIFPSPSPSPMESDEKSPSAAHSPPPSARGPGPRSPNNAQSRRRKEIRQHFNGMMAQRRSGSTFDDLSDFDFKPAEGDEGDRSLLDTVDAPKHNTALPIQETAEYPPDAPIASKEERGDLRREEAKDTVVQTIMSKRSHQSIAELPCSPVLPIKQPASNSDSDTDLIHAQPGTVTRHSSFSSSSSERLSAQNSNPQQQRSRAQSISNHIDEMLRQQGIQRATWNHIDIPYEHPRGLNPHPNTILHSSSEEEKSEPDFWRLSQDSAPDAVENRAANSVPDGPMFFPSAENMGFARHDESRDVDCASKTSSSDASSACNIRSYRHRYDAERRELETSMAMARCRVCAVTASGGDDELRCQHERCAYERERERQLEEATTSPFVSKSQARTLPLGPQDPVFPSSDVVSPNVQRQVETLAARRERPR